MRKLKLDIHALEVDTFEAAAAKAGRAGTVHARITGSCPGETDYRVHTCDIASCGGTCIITYVPCGTCGYESEIDLC